MALTRVARPPPLDARLHLPFVTSTHRSILGVTFAAESALNQCPCSASIGRATPLSRYSSSFATSTLPHPFTTYSHDDLLYPCAELSDVTSQPHFHHHIVKVPYSIRPSRHLPSLAAIRIHSASSPFERHLHNLVRYQLHRPCITSCFNILPPSPTCHLQRRMQLAQGATRPEPANSDKRAQTKPQHLATQITSRSQLPSNINIQFFAPSLVR